MRRALITLLVLAVFGACIGGAVRVVKGQVSGPPAPLDTPDVVVFSLRAAVESGTIHSVITTKGEVISGAPDVYLVTETVVFANKREKETFLPAYGLGETVEAGQALYTFKGKEFAVKCNCRVVDYAIDDFSAQFTLLNFDALYVAASVPLEQVGLLALGTPVSLTAIVNGSEQSFTGIITNFGYEVVDGKADVLIRPQARLLPGTPVKAAFSVTRTTESLFILKQMLLADGDGYYVEVEQVDGTRTRHQVQIGEFFEMPSEGVAVEFVEITSGLSLGQMLVIDVVE